MTKQEIFNIVAAHLMKQGCISVSSLNYCVYRNPEGLRCAVGCLITDDEYDPAMDDRGIAGETGVRYLIEKGLLPERLIPHADFLVELQCIHDTVPVACWKAELLEAARDHGLEIPSCLKVEEDLR